MWTFITNKDTGDLYTYKGERVDGLSLAREQRYDYGVPVNYSVQVGGQTNATKIKNIQAIKGMMNTSNSSSYNWKLYIDAATAEFGTVLASGGKNGSLYRLKGRAINIDAADVSINGNDPVIKGIYKTYTTADDDSSRNVIMWPLMQKSYSSESYKIVGAYDDGDIKNTRGTLTSVLGTNANATSGIMLLEDLDATNDTIEAVRDYYGATVSGKSNTDTIRYWVSDAINTLKSAGLERTDGAKAALQFTGSIYVTGVDASAQAVEDGLTYGGSRYDSLGLGMDISEASKNDSTGKECGSLGRVSASNGNVANAVSLYSSNIDLASSTIGDISSGNNMAWIRTGHWHIKPNDPDLPTDPIGEGGGTVELPEKSVDGSTDEVKRTTSSKLDMEAEEWDLGYELSDKVRAGMYAMDLGTIDVLVSSSGTYVKPTGTISVPIPGSEIYVIGGNSTSGYDITFTEVGKSTTLATLTHVNNSSTTASTGPSSATATKKTGATAIKSTGLSFTQNNVKSLSEGLHVLQATCQVYIAKGTGTTLTRVKDVPLTLTINIVKQPASTGTTTFTFS